MHHKLRRDPNWDPRGCNLCGEVRPLPDGVQPGCRVGGACACLAPHVHNRITHNPAADEHARPSPVMTSGYPLQVGHQAAMCPNGTVNWKQIYGEEAFVLKSPIFESELRARRKLKEVNIDDLEQRARSYAKVCKQPGEIAQYSSEFRSQSGYSE